MKISSVQEFLTIVAEQQPEMQQALRNVEASEKTWLEILEAHPELKRLMTLNRTLPESVLQRLANDIDPNVRCDVANRRGLSASLFLELAHDTDESVRSRIAWNKKTPVDLLKGLSTDSAEIVRVPAREALKQRCE
jgi:hypothetical protein